MPSSEPLVCFLDAFLESALDLRLLALNRKCLCSGTRSSRFAMTTNTAMSATSSTITAGSAMKNAASPGITSATTSATKPTTMWIVFHFWLSRW